MDATRIIGLHIRRIRKARDKSLQVISGLAGMSISTLHRIEHGQRELTLSEIVALANALEITPAKLIRLPILAPVGRSPAPIDHNLAPLHLTTGMGLAHD